MTVEPTFVVLPAAGLGRRLGLETRKAHALVAGEPLACHAIRTVQQCPGFCGGALVVHEQDLEQAHLWLSAASAAATWQVVEGGARRRDSVAAGVAVAPEPTRFLAIHDAARPLLSLRDLRQVVEVAHRLGAAILAKPVVDSLKRAQGGKVQQSMSRDDLWQAETPQVLRIEWFRRGQLELTDSAAITDECGLLEGLGLEVNIVQGKDLNLKVTRPGDLLLVEALLGRSR